ncbi:endo alpha-1,4 polygalactosaminidase [Mucilaginibacter sp. UR6-11]|uniref:endo alpha-1,4 polygalactosaminidase n=1 Tax=Mucilaginibacter sp. UR6-11 TaxID=1435644 RepID=UPI001E4CFD1E|nr:endo alpha-1,4 polygalactosaminidase [Mucilaginibacter sp. UR6-11]MCC8425955.1 endo alpha-1,4 polygalactosaminidase [Mucilaginibacter sp. UR6-11]
MLCLFSATVRAWQLPVWQAASQPADWLIKAPAVKAGVFKSADGKDLILDNGLLKRTFRLGPNLACTGFRNLSSGEELLRAVGPDAKLTIDGKTYAIGGLYGQPEKAYLKKEWIDGLKAHDGDFKFKSYAVGPIVPYVNWKPVSKIWAANKKQPTGKMLSLLFTSTEPALSGIGVRVNYELYDGIPLICKWLSVENKGSHKIRLNKVINEVLAVHEEESSVAGPAALFRPPHGIYVESNYAFNDAMNARFSDQTTHWQTDTTYTSQVSYDLQTPCVLEVYPPIGPGVELAPGQIFKSIRTNELLLEGYDRERNGLAQRLMYQTIAPWATQAPTYLFCKSFDERVVKNAIDQCAATGYDMLVLSFHTGFSMEDTTKSNIRYCKMLADYAHSKGILIGGYSLLASRRISDNDDVIDPKTGKPDVHALYAHSPCLGSRWGLAYFEKLKYFLKTTGFDEFDQDGAYPGDVCASTTHPGHKGLEDSQWTQMEQQKAFYHWCAENGIFVNTPDWYFLDGGSKCALGYREVNFSLPRPQQMILNRQNIYDGTWEKMPTMGWGFVPLTEYQGGGAEATIEPLSEHLDAYEQLMMQYYGAGIQACYLGTRLYDTEATKQLVLKTLNWYHQYRDILSSQLIHLRRADGQDWDGILHVNPNLKIKGMAMLYNPTREVMVRKIKLPLYYTGLNNTALISEMGDTGKIYQLSRDYNVEVQVHIPANGYTWLTVQE